jgi:hypothetical protein
VPDPDVARTLSELAARFGRPAEHGWTAPSDFWPLLERMREDGAVVVLKLDGQRTGDDAEPYTIVISGGPLGDDYVRSEREWLVDALGEAVVEYARAVWD